MEIHLPVWSFEILYLLSSSGSPAIIGGGTTSTIAIVHNPPILALLTQKVPGLKLYGPRMTTLVNKKKFEETWEGLPKDLLHWISTFGYSQDLCRIKSVWKSAKLFHFQLVDKHHNLELDQLPSFKHAIEVLKHIHILYLRFALHPFQYNEGFVEDIDHYTNLKRIVIETGSISLKRQFEPFMEKLIKLSHLTSFEMRQCDLSSFYRGPTAEYMRNFNNQISSMSQNLRSLTLYHLTIDGCSGFYELVNLTELNFTYDRKSNINLHDLLKNLTALKKLTVIHEPAVDGTLEPTIRDRLINHLSQFQDLSHLKIVRLNFRGDIHVIFFANFANKGFQSLISLELWQTRRLGVTRPDCDRKEVTYLPIVQKLQARVHGCIPNLRVYNDICLATLKTNVYNKPPVEYTTIENMFL